MLNPYEHPDADALMADVERVLDPIRGLVDRVRRDGADLVYVNDNYGDWNSSREELAQRALAGAGPDLVKPVLPPEGSSFVIKARHSIFYGTPLEYLLAQKEIGHLVLVGQVTEQCILYSALDAYVRQLQVTVPRDGVAHIDERLAEAALEMMQRNMDVELTACAECELEGSRDGPRATG
jgi:nicotinamidase-related amidase